MKLMTMTAALAASIWLCLVSAAPAQDAVPREILQRTKLIKAGDEAGTAFSIDYRGKIYLVTARHVVAGLPTGNATLQVWLSDKWEDIQIVKTFFPASADVDIAVLETEERASQSYPIAVQGQDESATLGQLVWFLGYPFADIGFTNRFQNQQVLLPFIKRGTMSAVDASNARAIILYIDGFNNLGFSGGPIIFFDFRKRAYRILGVVSGYAQENAKRLINGVHVDTDLLVNSGILVGYSIKHAIEAIDNDQK